MQFPTGGTAHEPKGMIRCNSEADSTVWMKEDETQYLYVILWLMRTALGCLYIPEFFVSVYYFVCFFVLP